MLTGLTAHRGVIAELCRHFGVRELAVFGSAFGLKEGIETLLVRPIDLVTPEALQNPYVAESPSRPARGCLGGLAWPGGPR
ncbi:MAG: nucleotidyltransferase family protein [Actinomycetes bacterium]